MKATFPRPSPLWIRLIVTVVVLIVGAATWSRWWPALNQWVQTTVAGQRPATPDEHGAGDDAHSDEHAGHGHPHSAENSLELSPQALKNLGLTEEFLRPVALQTYRRSISVPAVVAERPGRTHLQVATPMTGVVTHVHAVKGEAVEVGTLLFEIRLTHEDLVQTQTEFLKGLGDLEVENREIARLQAVTESGAIAGKTLLERRYAKEKLESLLSAQREALRLHGLSERQVEQIASERRLLRDLQLVAPSPDEHEHDEELRLTTRPEGAVVFQEVRPGAIEPTHEHPPLIIDELDVHKGQSVESGGRLCQLSDYSRLYIEGRAFEQDEAAINAALARNWTVSAIFVDGREIDGLALAFLANEVDEDSRTLHFYVELGNEVVRDTVNADGQRFVTWRYRPGQRLELRVPVEEWPQEIVLPVDAVAQEGAEYYVFEQNGNHFDRAPVHVKYRDQHSVVIANDGSVFPGDVVALRSAHQMLMALKSKSGGGVDPHAGHNH